MEIPEREKATTIPDGVCVTRTENAEYFYFKLGDQIVNVRLPIGPDAAGCLRTIEVTCRKTTPVFETPK